MRKIFFAMLSVWIMSVSANLYATDFTFEVPVRLTNLHPDITQGNVRCDVLDERPIVIGTSGGSSPGFSISGGHYEGTVTVAFNATQPWRARTYRCELMLRRGGRAGEGAMTESAINSTYGADSGAAFIVRGDIPAPPTR
jgi:hypothetical protein